jgi:hypothetical protein
METDGLGTDTIADLLESVDSRNGSNDETEEEKFVAESADSETSSNDPVIVSESIMGVKFKVGITERHVQQRDSKIISDWLDRLGR